MIVLNWVNRRQDFNYILSKSFQILIWILSPDQETISEDIDSPDPVFLKNMGQKGYRDVKADSNGSEQSGKLIQFKHQIIRHHVRNWGWALWIWVWYSLLGWKQYYTCTGLLSIAYQISFVVLYLLLNYANVRHSTRLREEHEQWNIPFRGWVRQVRGAVTFTVSLSAIGERRTHQGTRPIIPNTETQKTGKKRKRRHPNRDSCSDPHRLYSAADWARNSTPKGAAERNF